jgi:hypothetical protein
MLRAPCRAATVVVAVLIVLAASCAGRAAAAALSPTSLGANVHYVYANGAYTPSDLSVASANGLGMARIETDQGTNLDPIVRWLAKAHLTLYPTLGLPCPAGTTTCTAQTQIPPATATSEMSQYITAFAKRYGPKGIFWSQNPTLPYEPITRYEIGNEPNIRLVWVQDDTHLHWPLPGDANLADMSDYAQVYEAARAALHKVLPSGVAVVGGLADSAGLGVDINSDTSLLKALTRGAVDAVGYHPWTYDVNDALMIPDLLQLRDWMDTTGYSGVPLDINEFGACENTSGSTNGQSCYPAQTSATWGSVAASYTKWTLCTSWLHVANVQPFYWGGISNTAQVVWLPLVSASGTLTAYGTDYFGEAKSLTATGCPAAQSGTAPTNSVNPAITGTAKVGSTLTGNPGTWTGSPTPTLYYQWVRCGSEGPCAAIEGANKTTYKLTSDDQGTRIRLIVDAGNVAGSVTLWANKTAVIAASS